MRYGQNICQREGCGYALKDLDLVDGQVVCPECGEINSDRVYTPFPHPKQFVHMVSKPWYLGVVVGALMSVPAAFIAPFAWGLGLVLSICILGGIYIAIIMISRRLVLREVQYAETIPDWAWNGFFMPTAVWSVAYWVVIVVVLSLMN